MWRALDPGQQALLVLVYLRKGDGMNPQVIASPDGTILWVSGHLPGSTRRTGRLAKAIHILQNYELTTR